MTSPTSGLIAANAHSGIAARMTPVPRKLSSSCGTCVRYEAPEPCQTLLDEDAEAVYHLRDGAYELVWKTES